MSTHTSLNKKILACVCACDFNNAGRGAGGRELILPEHYGSSVTLISFLVILRTLSVITWPIKC